MAIDQNTPEGSEAAAFALEMAITASAADVPDNLHIPQWTWNGLVSDEE